MIKNIGDYKDNIDGTIKCVYEKDDNKIIEISILFNKDDRDVVCVPTHHFCNLGCKMCHLTNNKLNKHMDKIMYDDFIYCLLDTLKKYKRDKDKLLISFMGVGEPLLNIDLILDVYKNEDILKSIGYSDISYSIATMMPNNNLEVLSKYVDELNIPLKVHFSMHNPLDYKRKELIPSTRVDVKSALNLLNEYKNIVLNNKNIMDKYNKFHKNMPIEIHYTLIDKVNDGSLELNELISLLKEVNITLKFIRFNETNELSISSKENEWVNKIKDEINGIVIKRYTPPGRCVGSSCGEFTKHYYHAEIETKEEYAEFKEWESKYKIKTLGN